MIKQIKNNLKYWLVVLVLLLADLLASFISLVLSFNNNEIVFNLRLIFLINFFILTLIFYANGRYKADPTISRFKEIQSIFRITLSYTIENSSIHLVKKPNIESFRSTFWVIISSFI